MKISEFSKPVPAQGIFARLLGKKDLSYALGISMGPESVDELEKELQAAKEAIIDWCSKRQKKDFILFTVFANDTVCQAIRTNLPEMCRGDDGLSANLQGVHIELSLNGKEKLDI